MSALGLKCRMELDIAVGGRSAKGQGEHVLLGDTFEDESRIAGKAKASVERWISDQNTPVCADLAEFCKSPLHEGSPDATALPLRLDRNRAKPVPANCTITDRQRRERDVPDDATGFFGNE